MARERPKASDVPPPTLTCLEGGRISAGAPLLTRAQAQALRRSAPLTYSQLREHFHNGAGARKPDH